MPAVATTIKLPDGQTVVVGDIVNVSIDTNKRPYRMHGSDVEYWAVVVVRTKRGRQRVACLNMEDAIQKRNAIEEAIARAA